MQHTFQVGDRVMGKGYYMKSMANDNEPGTVAEVKHHGVEVAMDRRELNRDKGVWFLAFDAVSHDTDFKVGDWVRYEKMDEVGTEEWNGKIGVITLVDEDCHPTADVYKIENRLLQANLVKIQPPQEAHMNPEEGPFAPHVCDDAIERGIKEKIQLLERQVEKAKCCLETYRDLKVFLNQGESHGTR